MKLASYLSERGLSPDDLQAAALAVSGERKSARRQRSATLLRLLERAAAGYHVAEWTEDGYPGFEYRVLAHAGQPPLDDDVELLAALGGERFDVFVNVNELIPCFFMFCSRTLLAPTGNLQVFEPAASEEAVQLMGLLRGALLSGGVGEMSVEEALSKVEDAETELSAPGETTLFDCVYTDLVTPKLDATVVHGFGKPTLEGVGLTSLQQRDIAARMWGAPSRDERPLPNVVPVSSSAPEEARAAIARFAESCGLRVRECGEARFELIVPEAVNLASSPHYEERFETVFYVNLERACYTAVRKLKARFANSRTTVADLVALKPENVMVAGASSELRRNGLSEIPFGRTLALSPTGTTWFAQLFAPGLTPSFKPTVRSNLRGQFGESRQL